MQIRAGRVSLVAFEPAYTRVVFDIRNDPTVRAGMRDTSELKWEDHVRWVQENLVGQQRQLLFIAYEAQEPVGLALLRDFQGAAAEIGIMVKEPGRHARSAYHAAHMLAIYAFYTLGIDALYSNVPRRNARALKFNLHCGFEDTGQPSHDYHVLVLTKKRSQTVSTHNRFLRRHPLEIIE